MCLNNYVLLNAFSICIDFQFQYVMPGKFYFILLIQKIISMYFSRHACSVTMHITEDSYRGLFILSVHALAIATLNYSIKIK